MGPKQPSDDADLLNYRVLAEAAKNNQLLTLAQQEQLEELSKKLQLPNPLGQPQTDGSQEPEFLQRAREDFQKDNEETKRRGWISTLISAAEVIGGAIILAVVINQFIFQPYEVVGISMQPTLENGDRLIVSKVGHTVSKITRKAYVPHRYDIIVLKSSIERQFQTNDGDTQLVKRVIGLPGDRVVVNDGRITIYNQANPDGFNPDENLVTRNITTTGNIDITIKPGEVFVCGDNRANSLDSRSNQVGTVQSDHIVGRVRMRLLPLTDVTLL